MSEPFSVQKIKDELIARDVAERLMGVDKDRPRAFSINLQNGMVLIDAHRPYMSTSFGKGTIWKFDQHGRALVPLEEWAEHGLHFMNMIGEKFF